MEQTQNYTNFNNSEFNALSGIFLEFYENGKYSDEGLQGGECNAGARKTLKHTFKEHILGDAKYIHKHNGESKKWARYTGCLLKILLECDTSKVIEKNRKIKSLNKEIKELNESREREIQRRVNDSTKFVMNDARATVDEELRERADRIEGRFKKYQESLNRYQEENKRLNDELNTCVDRSVFDEQNSTILDMKLQLEKERGSPKKKELTPEDIKKKKIKKKKKELKELMAQIDANSSSDDESSSSEEE